jgi:hypothetical protein
VPRLSIRFIYRRAVPRRGPTTPGTSPRFGLFRFRSPLLTESILFLFLRLLRCFTSPGIACLFLPSIAGFGKERWRITTIRLPHSEISGSKRTCRSPKLIAAYHVLHRLLAPRHSLCALKSLIPCLKSATRTSWTRDRGSWIVDFIFKSFHALRVLRPTYNRFCQCWLLRHFAVKIFAFGNQNIFKDRKNGSRIAPLCNFLQSIKSYFSPYGCQRADFACCRAEPTVLLRKMACHPQPGRAKDGGPDRTRTYDPRLIKAVL